MFTGFHSRHRKEMGAGGASPRLEQSHSRARAIIGIGIAIEPVGLSCAVMSPRVKACYA